ncbi:MAG: ATP-dependent metallopeptidase FtsH/Yme1/Tma family protein [Epsilonproteobacteria bacterium]|nr:ATP-dependent metallopeptidase FtsH/Yme1/Tma family protein [Campylobacterota bacterium]
MQTMQYFKNKKLIYSLSALVVVLALLAFGYYRNRATFIDQETYQELLSNGNIKSAQIQNNQLIIETTSGKRYKIVKDGVDIKKLVSKVPVSIKEQSTFLDDLLSGIILFLMIFAFILYLRKKDLKNFEKIDKERNKQSALDLENFMSTPIKPAISDITFKDVAGIGEVKEELQEIVDFLKNPVKYKNFGIKLPKGVLLVGPPGVGKTMIAKAVAGEANVPFFYQSGSSFVQIYVGIGAKRVRELFAYAKKYAPSIIFIDEIDAVGKARGNFRNDERESTLNQLLSEMDGFEDSSGVIVIAATNKIEVLDEALLRSGRFDRRVFVSLPDKEEREAIINIYLKNKKHNVNTKNIADITVGFSGAALSTLVNEAAINALKRGSYIIEESDFYAVRDKVLLGKKKILSFSEREKEIQALYQAAKALSAYWFDLKFDKVSIISDGIKDVDKEIESKSEMISKIKVYLSGIVATEIFYQDRFSNSINDLQKAKDLADIMIEKYGMGNTLYPNKLDASNILEEAKGEVKKFLEGYSAVLEKIKEHILKYEIITKEELKEIINEVF